MHIFGHWLAPQIHK